MKPLALIILDGYGKNDNIFGNAIASANTPNIDNYLKTCPYTYIGASGMEVGLPEGQMGNSEVGHTNIGAGRVVYQELTRISKSIKDKDFFTNEEFSSAVYNCKKNNSAFHIMGLVSDGGVHSHNTHIYALLQLAKEAGLTDVNVHCFMDGRDVPPSSGLVFLDELNEKMKEIGVGKIASVMGRYYAMDRENKWDRVELAYNAMINKNTDFADCYHAMMEESYKNNITDEFIKPIFIAGASGIKDKDSIIFANFRPDRAREITRVFVDDEFTGFAREKRIDTYFVCMTQYDITMPNVSVAYKPQSLDLPFGEIISKKGLKQLRIAEFTKYAHVTFFFNGGVEKVYEGEDRILVDSPNVATFDLKPEMSAYEVCDKVVDEINASKHDVIILNYANCDMVGHTGIFDAAKAAVEAVDVCVGKTVNAILAKGGMAIITADHGNADQMCEPDGSPFTAHTTNPVPLIFVSNYANDIKLKEDGKLADIAPTMLHLLKIEKPGVMDGESLII